MSDFELMTEEDTPTLTVVYKLNRKVCDSFLHQDSLISSGWSFAYYNI